MRSPHARQARPGFLMPAFKRECENVLDLIGSALEAECIILLIGEIGSEHSDPARSRRTLEPIVWHSNGARSQERLEDALSTHDAVFGLDASIDSGRVGDHVRLVVPLSTPECGLEGYACFQYEDTGEDGRTPTHALGDVISGCLGQIVRADRSDYTSEIASPDVESIPTPVLIVFDGAIVSSNRQAAALLGVESARDLTGRLLIDHMDASDFGAVEKLLRASQLNEPTEPARCTLIRSDGHERHVEMIGMPIAHEGDAAVQIVVRVLTEQEVELERLRSLISTIKEGLFHIEFDDGLHLDGPEDEQVDDILQHGVVQRCNDEMADFFGFRSADDVIEKPVERVLTGLDREIIEAFVRHRYNLSEYEHRRRYDDGTVRLFAVNASSRFRNARLTEIWGSCTDISDRMEIAKRGVRIREREQMRIARDLHDRLGPLVTSVQLISNNLASSADLNPTYLENQANKIATYTDYAQYELNALFGEHPKINGTNLELADLLAGLAETFDSVADASIRFTCMTHKSVENDLAVKQLYFIGREALTNALKHGHPDRIDLSLRYEDGSFVLEIRDDGLGFETSNGKNVDRNSLGLDSMRDRAHTIGASFNISSRQDQGTSVVCVAPDKKLEQ